MICTADKMPQTIREVETRYWVIVASKFALLEMIMGGVIIPASIARACWNPKRRARMTGMRSWRPKNGARLLDFFMNGKLGLKRKAMFVSHSSVVHSSSTVVLTIIIGSNEALLGGKSLENMLQMLSKAPLG